MPYKKEKKYDRIIIQLKELFQKTDDPFAKIATATAVLHNKFSYYYWTGYYRLINGELTVTSYQGSHACLVLKKDVGVCWKGINSGETVLISNVHEFPGHIACDSRSNSEIVIPVKDKSGKTVGLIDVDSTDFNSFDEDDRAGLEKIAFMFYSI